MPIFKRKRFISYIGRKSAVPDGLWMKCAGCNQAIYKNDVEQNKDVCPSCGHHYRMNATKRIQITTDPGSFEETHANIRTRDPLDFTVGGVTYLQKVQKAQDATGLPEAVVTGFARVDDIRTVLAVMDPTFIMGSMGSALGEKFCRAAEDAVRERVPFVLFAASGGARMQEGILSLMQMAKTANAVRLLNDEGIPYISVLTDPTTGGVYASMASLGDIILAEPGAYIGFAGARLIEGALKVKLPQGFQLAEYQYANGFIDRIVPRTEMREQLGKLLKYLPPRAA
jgi:acetyl-CoA carboxylase carboxyl transferase subunit beta